MQLFIPIQTNICHNYQRGNHNFETKTNLSTEVHLECIMLIGTQCHAILICVISIKCTSKKKKKKVNLISCILNNNVTCTVTSKR